MDAEGRIGALRGREGAKQLIRLGLDGEVIVSSSNPGYREANREGLLFATVGSTAGVAPGTALSTTPPFCLHNPTNSGKVLSLVRVRMGFISGTLGAGTVFLCAVLGQTTPPTGGSNLGTFPTSIAGTGTASVAKSQTGCTVATTPIALAPLFSMGAEAAATAVQPVTISEWLDGEYEVQPGTCAVLQAVAAAGTSPLVIFGMTWKEIAL